MAQRKVPDEDETVLLATFVEVFSTMICALGTAEPDSSEIVPTIVPVALVWAKQPALMAEAEHC